MAKLTEKMLTVKEIAQAVGVSPQSVYGWAHKGKHFAWSLSSDGRYFAKKKDVVKFAAGYAGPRRSAK